MASVDFYSKDQVDTKLTSKQDTLVSGTNIKTINNQSILGSGDIPISGVTAHTYSNFGSLAADIIAKRKDNKFAHCILGFVGLNDSTKYADCRITGVSTSQVRFSYLYIKNADSGTTGKELSIYISAFTILPSSTDTNISLSGLGQRLDIVQNSSSDPTTMSSTTTYDHTIDISNFVLYY